MEDDILSTTSCLYELDRSHRNGHPAAPIASTPPGGGRVRPIVVVYVMHQIGIAVNTVMWVRHASLSCMATSDDTAADDPISLQSMKFPSKLGHLSALIVP